MQASPHVVDNVTNTGQSLVIGVKLGIKFWS